MYPVEMKDVFSGYDGKRSDWKSFLECWRSVVSERMARGESYNGLLELPAAINLVARGEDTSTELAKIGSIEARMGVTFPQSYKDFVVASLGRGWFVEALGEIGPGGTYVGGLIPIEEIGWFHELENIQHKNWLDSAATQTVDLIQYFRYDFLADPLLRQNPVLFSKRDLTKLILVGRLSEGAVLLLNVQQETADHELESWVLDPRTPGATRFRSFAEMMLAISLGDSNNGGPIISPREVNSEFRCGRFLKTAGS